MTKRLGVTVWAASTLMLAALGACTNSADAPAHPSASAVSTPAPTTASPGPSSTSPSEAAASDASATMRRYFAVTDKVGQNPTASLRPLASVATSAQLMAVRTLLQSQHAKGQRQLGDTRVAELTVQSINLDNTDPSAGRVPTALIDVCWDVSKVDVVDRGGQSIVRSGRPDTGWTRYVVANYRWSADPRDGWRVASGHDLKQAPCAAS